MEEAIYFENILIEYDKFFEEIILGLVDKETEYTKIKPEVAIN